VKNLVKKVYEMGSQREMLVSQLRESVLRDDITGQLVTNASDGGILDVVFENEILKHQPQVRKIHKLMLLVKVTIQLFQPQVAILEQNLAAQANILRALTDAYARYAPSRKAASSASRKRQGTIAALLASFNAREDLLAKANKGLEFYCRLEGSVSKLLARVKSVCKVQEEERQQQHKASHPLPKTTQPEVPINTGNPKLKDYLQV
jgi:tyrosine-protein phosphatase non-receptor type 23